MGRAANRPSRRGVLASAGTALTAAFGGCTGVVGTTGRVRPVTVLAAGSLSLALREGLAPRTEAPLRIEAHGSVAAARMVAEGQRRPDIVALADPALFRTVTDARWVAEFATNAIVVATNTSTRAGRRIAAAEPWFRPLLETEVALGRTDPRLDPLGYRTLFALELASRFYDRDGLVDAVVEPDQVYPETALLSHFESGSLDAAFVYRNMAVERDYDHVALPGQVNLGDPEHAADWYETVTYDLPNGGTVSGSPVKYGATIRAGRDTDSVRRVFDALVSGDFLDDYGFGTPSAYPDYTGDVPDRLAI